MMLHPSRLTRLLFSVAALGLALAWGPGEADAAGRAARSGRLADANGSLVLCASVPLPVPVAAVGHAPVHRIADEGVFAPTREAMFFSHPGDRCVWRAGAPARG